MLLVLTGVTAVSVALLAYVNELTKGPIAEANAKTLNEALKKFFLNLRTTRWRKAIRSSARKTARRMSISLFIRPRTVIIW